MDMVPAYSEVDPSAVNYRPAPGAYDYYLNEARGNVPEYRNESAIMGLDEFLEFDPVSKASAITTPTRFRPLLAGETDPTTLAALADQRLRATSDQLRTALEACVDLIPCTGDS